jgi:two-component system chemotaxis response regulator CheB
MVEKIKTAASIRSRPKRSMLPKKSENPFKNAQLDSEQVLAIGSSTGGTEALRLILENLPDRIPGVVIVQHIPPVFSAAFAKRMNELCPFEVKEAKDGDAVQANRVLIAPGDFHMHLVGKGKNLRVRLDQAPARNGHRPSVDVLFESVARQVGPQAVGVILTGMGADGAKGLLKMREAGARTVGQSEESCVVYGMPREAAKIGAVQHVADLDKIPEILTKLLSPKKRKAA